MTCKEYNYCRLCKSPSIDKVLDFGETALANSFRSSIRDEVVKYPLGVNLCSNCGCVQLTHSVDPSVLFSNYLYSSSRSGLSSYFEGYANEFQIKGGTVLEIGSNDGVLLLPFQKNGWNVIGVEPAANLAAEANSKGLHTINTFFNKGLAQELPHIDLIVANNVFAHIDDIDSVVDGIKIIMDKNPNCIFVFENAYWLDTVKAMSFDQIYHEHIFYHLIKPLDIYFQSHGLVIFDIKKTPIQGGSVRVYVMSKNNTSNFGDGVKVKEFVRQEELAGIYDKKFYEHFNDKINKLKSKVKILTSRLTCSIYGAPAKLTTLYSVLGLGLDIDYVVDDSNLKRDKFLPGENVRVVSSEHFKNNPTDICLISAWNFSDQIKSKNNFYEGVWINPINI